MNALVKPLKLQKGDKVAAVTLSWGGPGTYPYRFEIGKQRLEEIFGLHVVPSKHALKSAQWIADNPEARASDLMEAFCDPSIKGIFSTIGGDDSAKLIPHIDLNIIRNNPKVFLGYSDTTVTHFMCLKAGVSSFYGPAIMTAFAENISMHDYTITGIKKTLFSSQIIGQIPNNSEGWTKEFLNWANEENQKIKRILNPAKTWNFIGDKENICRGRLIGGCLETLEHLSQTELWPELSVWNESILFLETSENDIEPSQVADFISKLARQGILNHLNGILFSKPGGEQITAECFAEYDLALLKIFEEFDLPLIPIVTGMDFGHSDPMWTLPFGAMCQIDPIKESVTILESGVL